MSDLMRACVRLFYFWARAAFYKDDKMAPPPQVTFFKHAWVVDIVAILTQTAPAYFLDLVRIMRREKPKYTKGLSMLTTLRKAMQPFIGRSWQFRSPRARALLRSLPPADRPLFPADPAHIQWRPYLAACFRGVQRHLLKKTK